MSPGKALHYHLYLATVTGVEKSIYLNGVLRYRCRGSSTREWWKGLPGAWEPGFGLKQLGPCFFTEFVNTANDRMLDVCDALVMGEAR